MVQIGVVLKEKNPQVDKDYQDLFLRSPLGPKVLGKILDDAGFMNIANGDEERIENNVIKMILAHCGIGLGMKGEAMIRALAGKKIENVAASGEDAE